MSRWIKYNANPHKNRVNDCVIRAISLATGEDWETIHEDISDVSRDMGDMPDANIAWGQYLYEIGFRRYLVDDYGQDRYTVNDFCIDHPLGVYLLAIKGHIVCTIDGYFYDTWDSGGEIPLFYWKR